jgi:hypothetical protein
MPFPEWVSLGLPYSMFQSHHKAIRDKTKGLSVEEGLFFRQKQLDLNFHLWNDCHFCLSSYMLLPLKPVTAKILVSPIPENTLNTCADFL